MSGGASHQKSKSVDLTPQEFVGLRGGVADQLGGFLTQDFGNLQQDFQTGPFAQLTGGEQSTLAGLGNFRGVDVNQQASQRQNEFLSSSFLDVGNDPRVQSAIDVATRPVFEGLARAGQDATAAFVNAGQSPGQSTPFQQEAGRIQQEALRSAGDISSTIVGQELARRQEIQQGAVGQEFADRANQQTFELQRQLETLQAQGLPRLVQELGIERGIAEFQRTQQQLLAGIELATQASSPNLGTKSSGSSAQGGVG